MTKSCWMDEKTNRVNVAQFVHIKMMYASELSEFSVGQEQNKNKTKQNQLVTEKKQATRSCSGPGFISLHYINNLTHFKPVHVER